MQTLGTIHPLDAEAASTIAPITTRAGTKALAAERVRSGSGNADAHDPVASPLHGSRSGLPPICTHAGDDEVLLDDALRHAVSAVSLTHLRENLSAATVRQPDVAFAMLDTRITPSPGRGPWPAS